MRSTEASFCEGYDEVEIHRVEDDGMSGNYEAPHSSVNPALFSATDGEVDPYISRDDDAIGSGLPQIVGSYEEHDQ